MMNFVEYLHELKGAKPPFPDAYGEWLGYQIEDYNCETGEAVTRLKVTDAHLSPSSAVHGGVISGFLDFTCGCAVFAVIDRDALCSTVDLNVKYFKPLVAGDEVIARAHVLHKGHTLSSVLANLYKANNDEILVAMASGTFNIYKPKHIPTTS